MIWILVWFLAAAVIAPVIGKGLHRLEVMADTNDLTTEIENWLINNYPVEIED